MKKNSFAIQKDLQYNKKYYFIKVTPPLTKIFEIIFFQLGGDVQGFKLIRILTHTPLRVF